MTAAPLTIWCNADFPPAVLDALQRRLGVHRLIQPAGLQASNLVAGGPDPLLDQADIAFGQPDPGQAMQSPYLKWVQLTSAGYTRYDRDDLRAAFDRRGAIMTNSSSVYAEPCAEHLLAMILANARQLIPIAADQFSTHAWRTPAHRAASRLLPGQNVLILGFGAIANRLVELLGPLKMNIIAVRRRQTQAPGVQIIRSDKVDDALARADHVVNILPATPATDHYLDARRLALLKPGANLYNIGRGSTVDQSALASALMSGRLAGAYLDVTDPEPLPGDHPLWTAPRCYITPHTAGGHDAEFFRLAEHFADNLDRYLKGEPLADRIV